MIFLVIYCIYYCPSDAKRLIGRRFDDSIVQSDMKLWPFTVIDDASRPKVQVEYKGETKTFYPEEISSMVLAKMKEIAEAYLGKVQRCAFVFTILNLDLYSVKIQYTCIFMSKTPHKGGLFKCAVKCAVLRLQYSGCFVLCKT